MNQNIDPSYSSHDDHNSSDMWWNVKSFVWETVKVVIISLAIIIPVRYFLIQPFYVQGASMEPNFLDREYLIIDEISYRLDSPVRGDIVVFRYPRDPKQFFIKRIIGLPGEQVEIHNGVVRIFNATHAEGIVLDESDYLSSEVITSGNLRVGLGNEDYFVLGDNRTSSLDSRSFGAISEEAIVGKVWLRGWPLSRVQTF